MKRDASSAPELLTWMVSVISRNKGSTINLDAAENTRYLSKNAFLFQVVYNFLFVEKIPYAICA